MSEDAENSDDSETRFVGCGTPVANTIFALRESIEKRDDWYCPWPGSTVSWAVENNSDYLSLQDCESEIEAAFAVWALESGLNAIQAGSIDEADVTIGFYCSDAVPELVLSRNIEYSAIAYNACANDAINRGRIVFNAKVNWGLDQKSISGTLSKFHCFAVHEIGHAVGINVHGAPPKDVMQSDPDYWPGILTANDIEHITSLYPKGDPDHKALS